MQLDKNPSLMLFFFSKVSPDGASAYLAYLDNSETDVHIQKIDPNTFATVGPALTVTGAKEGAWLPFYYDRNESNSNTLQPAVLLRRMMALPF